VILQNRPKRTSKGFGERSDGEVRRRVNYEYTFGVFSRGLMGVNEVARVKVADALASRLTLTKLRH